MIINVPVEEWETIVIDDDAPLTLLDLSAISGLSTTEVQSTLREEQDDE